MKSLSLIFFALVILAFTGCKQIDKILTFNINKSQTITVPKMAVLPGLTILGPPVTVTSDTKEEFKKQNTAAELVKDVTLTKIVLNMEAPADEDFGFLKDVELLIGVPNESDVSIAYLNDIPADAGRSLELNTHNVKLDKYIKASTFTLRTRGTADESVLNDITVKVDMTFKVTADPL